MGVTIQQTVCLFNKLLIPGLHSAIHLSISERNTLIQILCRWRVVFYMQACDLQAYPSLIDAVIITDSLPDFENAIYIVTQDFQLKTGGFKELITPQVEESNMILLV